MIANYILPVWSCDGRGHNGLTNVQELAPPLKTALLSIWMQINNSHINSDLSGLRLVMCTGILIIVNRVEVTFELCPQVVSSRLITRMIIIVSIAYKKNDHNLPTLY